MADEATDGRPDDAAVVRAAVDAAEDVIFSRYDRSTIRDLDVTVHFDDGQLAVDVYLDVPDDPEAERVADDAALAARGAVDALLEG
ncbi:MAG: DUF3194 domain-containing protein [Halobacteriales archaeon]